MQYGSNLGWMTVVYGFKHNRIVARFGLAAGLPSTLIIRSK